MSRPGSTLLDEPTLPLAPARAAAPRRELWMGRLKKLPRVLWGRWTLRRASSVGSWTRVRGRPQVSNHGTMIVGSRVRIVSTPVRSELACEPGGTLRIGDGTFVNYGTSIAARASIEIGRDCQIGTYCIILDNDYHSVEPERRNILPPSEPIVIGDNVWLGARVTVLKGVRIGDGAVVGAGSVVTRDIPARSVAVGVPARVIRTS
jgi:acetyltransferase-like isoleucine patch superfamily enzyme